MAGLLAYSLSVRLPIPIHQNSGKVCSESYREHSSGYCPGFSPGSLLSELPDGRSEP